MSLLNKKFKITIIVLVFTALCILRVAAEYLTGSAGNAGILI